MERRHRGRGIAFGLAVAVVVSLITAHADGRDLKSQWTAALPPGWHEVDRQLTGVLIPVQVFAAATYPIVLHHRPGQCGPPRSVLAEMPPDGALLQVVEYPPRALDGDPLRVPRLPRRPAHFTWADATWARFECAGPSYKFDYRQAGHALQAQVWMHPTTVAPRLRARALEILDNLKKERPANRRTALNSDCHRTLPGDPNLTFFHRSALSGSRTRQPSIREVEARIRRPGRCRGRDHTNLGRNYAHVARRKNQMCVRSLDGDRPRLRPPEAAAVHRRR